MVLLGQFNGFQGEQIIPVGCGDRLVYLASQFVALLAAVPRTHFQFIVLCTATTPPKAGAINSVSLSE